MSLDLLQRFKEITSFLKTHQNIFEIEYLKKYPTPYPKELRSWLDEMQTWDDSKIASLESSPHEDLVISPSFKSYLKSIRTLQELPQSKLGATKLPTEITTKLSQKKSHELALLKTKIDLSKKEKIIDIGGGIGHTSLSAVYNTQKKSLCVDQDPELLKKGVLKLKKTDSINFEQVKFTHKKISRDSPFKTNTSNLTIGLHSCGDLSVEIINSILGTKNELILFGCCYHKIEKGLYQSQASSENKLSLSTNALHLASRSAKKIGKLEIEKRKIFKRHRYSLHYFMHDNFQSVFKGIGNSGAKDYQKPFGLYAKSIKTYTELDKIKESELETFYELPKTIKIFKDNFNADIIRLLLGRLIELYIILDRALYLQEHGHDVLLTELFDRSLSPRNIMLECSTLKT